MNQETERILVVDDEQAGRRRRAEQVFPTKFLDKGDFPGYVT